MGTIYTVDFQKPGLPHAHMLLALAPEDRLHTTADIDGNGFYGNPGPTAAPAGSCYSGQMHAPCDCLNPGAPCVVDM